MKRFALIVWIFEINCLGFFFSFFLVEFEQGSWEGARVGMEKGQGRAGREGRGEEGRAQPKPR